MTDIPGRCLSCGAVDTFGGLISPIGSAELTLDNVTMAGACRRCGGDVQLVDGTFDVKDEILSIIRAPGWTHETLDQLRRDLEWAREHFWEDPDRALGRIEQTSPATAGLVRRALAGQLDVGVIALLSLLVGVLALGVALYQTVTAPTAEDFATAVQKGVERALENQQLPSDEVGPRGGTGPCHDGSGLDGHDDPGSPASEPGAGHHPDGNDDSGDRPDDSARD